MSASITVLSSKATQALLAELAGAYEARSARKVGLESVGGVDAAARILHGEAIDIVVLASDAIDALVGAGRLVAESKIDLAMSGVAIAVRAGALRPDVGTESALRHSILAARNIGRSTGPSGVKLAELLERWGIAEEMRGRVTIAPAGVPVGTLIARGEVELGFQQLSELVELEGIDVVGPMPQGARIDTIFSAAISAGSTRADVARELLEFMASPAAANAKRRHGMEPITMRHGRGESERW
jgi:molybdate transport system substrate-binding protein